MKCSEPKCQKPSRARGMCRKHYQREVRREKGRPERRRPLDMCQHLRCPWVAVYRVTWPWPISRRENSCEAHCHSARLLGIKIERIESK